jgi:hypothetical protein
MLNLIYKLNTHSLQLTDKVEHHGGAKNHLGKRLPFFIFADRLGTFTPFKRKE